MGAAVRGKQTKARHGVKICYGRTPSLICLLVFTGRNRRVAADMHRGQRDDSREFSISKPIDFSLSLCLGSVPLILGSAIWCWVCLLAHLHANLPFYILCSDAYDKNPNSGAGLHLGKQGTRRKCFLFYDLQSCSDIAAQPLVILEGNQPKSQISITVVRQLFTASEFKLLEIIAVSLRCLRCVCLRGSSSLSVLGRIFFLMRPPSVAGLVCRADRGLVSPVIWPIRPQPGTCLKESFH